MGQANTAKAALDLYMCLSIPGLAAIVLVEMGAIVGHVLAVFADREVAFVVEAAKAGVYVDRGGQIAGDDHTDPGIGFEQGQFLDVIGDVELHIAGKFTGYLYVAVDLADTGPAVVEFKGYLPVIDLCNGGLAKFYVDIFHIIELPCGQAAEFAGQRDGTFKIGHFDPAKTVLEFQTIGGRHMDDIVDVKRPVLIAVPSFLSVAIVLYLAHLGLERDGMAALPVLDIDVIHDPLRPFFSWGLRTDLDIYCDLVLIPDIDHDVTKLVLYFELVIRGDFIAFINRSFFLYIISIMIGPAKGWDR